MVLRQSLLVCLIAFGARAQSGNARLQIVHASPDASMQKLDIFVQDSYPDNSLSPPLGSVSYAKSSGHLKVPSGKHKLIVCKAKVGGGCLETRYELEDKQSGTLVFIGFRGKSGREEEGSFTLVPQWGPGIADVETQRRMPSKGERRVTLLNAVEESQPLELCLPQAGTAPVKAPFALEKRPYKGTSLVTFGQWAGLGEIVDTDHDAAYATHVDMPKGRIPVELRVVGDESCKGKIWAKTGLEKPDDGMILLVAIGDAESDLVPRELLACSEPVPPQQSECFRHRLRGPDEPAPKKKD
jgi:hypothetical protein